MSDFTWAHILFRWKNSVCNARISPCGVIVVDEYDSIKYDASFWFFFIRFAQSHHIYNISRYFETTNLFNHTSYIVSLESRSVILSGYHFCVINCSRFDVRKLCAQLHSIWKCINPRSYGLCLYNKESARTRSHQRKFSKAKGKKLNHNAHTYTLTADFIYFFRS